MFLMIHKPFELVILMLSTNDLKFIFHMNVKSLVSGIGEYIKIIRNQYQWERFKIPGILVISPAEFQTVLVEKEGLRGSFDSYSLEKSGS